MRRASASRERKTDFFKNLTVTFLALTLLLPGFSVPFSQAATSSSKKLVSGFEKEIKKRESAITLSKANSDNGKQQNGLNYVAELKDIENVYLKALSDIQANLQTKLDESNKALAEAKLKWDQVNKIKLTTGFFGSDLSRINNVLECIPPYSDGSSPFQLVKRNCANNGGFPVPGDRIPTNPLSTYGGADWQKDDVTTINFVNANNSYLSDGIKFGFVVPFNPAEFEATRQKIAKAQSDIEKYSKDISTAKKSAEDNRFWQRLKAEEKKVIADNEFEDVFEKDLATFSDEISTLKYGLKAAKRAAKQGGNLKAAFTTALQFAYNVKGLDELASSPISYIDSLKSLRNIVEITKLSEEADLVDIRYTNSRAARINKLCGNVFIKDRKFKDLNYQSMLIYSKYVMS